MTNRNELPSGPIERRNPVPSFRKELSALRRLAEVANQDNQGGVDQTKVNDETVKVLAFVKERFNDKKGGVTTETNYPWQDWEANDRKSLAMAQKYAKALVDSVQKKLKEGFVVTSDIQPDLTIRIITKRAPKK